MYFPTQSPKNNQKPHSPTPLPPKLGKARKYFVFISGNLSLIKENNGTIFHLRVPKTAENPAEEKHFKIGLWLRADGHWPGAGKRERSEGETGLARGLRTVLGW